MEDEAEEQLRYHGLRGSVTARALREFRWPRAMTCERFSLKQRCVRVVGGQSRAERGEKLDDSR